MVLIKLSFLFQYELTKAVVLKSKSTKSSIKRKNKKTKNKSKKKKKSDKSSSKKSKKKSKKPSEKDIKIKENPKYVIDVGIPISYTHIEYNLLPEASKNKLDVVFWGPIVKV